MDSWFGYTDDADGDACTGGAGGLYESIGAGVYDDASADDGIFAAGDGDVTVNTFVVRCAGCVGHEIAHVAGMAFGAGGFSVGLILGVVVAAGAFARWIAHVAEGVDMKTVAGVGLQTFDVSDDLYAVRYLGEGHDPVGGVTPGRLQDCDELLRAMGCASYQHR